MSAVESTAQPQEAESVSNNSGSSDSKLGSLRCAISGETFSPSSCIVVTPSGEVCERRLLLSKLSENGGVDPFAATCVSLSEKDLVVLRVGGSASVVPPRGASSCSFPQLLRSMQNEHDGLLLELFDTRGALEETRRELSQALYQNDAAVRVIARLTMERDHARQQVKDTVRTGEAAGVEAPKVDADSGSSPEPSSKKRKVVVVDAVVEEENDQHKIPPADVSRMVSTWKTLSKARKKKTPPPPDHATPTFFVDHDWHVTADSYAAANNADGLLDVRLRRDGSQVLTAGSDLLVRAYDRDDKKEVATLTGADDVVSKLAVSDKIVLAASRDNMVRAYGEDNALLPDQLEASSVVVGLEIQPTQDYAIVTCRQRDIFFCRLDSTRGLTRLCVLPPHQDADDDATTLEYTATAVHPDGLILAVGTNRGTVQLWDLRSQTVVTTIKELRPDDDTHNPVRALDFSENGYHLLAAANDARVHVYDVRKLGGGQGRVLAATLNVKKEIDAVDGVAFCDRGKFLAYGGRGGIVVVAVKEWDKILAHMKDDGQKATTVRALAWGPNAKWLVSVTESNSVATFWGPKERLIENEEKDKDDADMKE